MISGSRSLAAEPSASSASGVHQAAASMLVRSIGSSPSKLIEAGSWVSRSA
jgi:hypothetical protein